MSEGKKVETKAEKNFTVKEPSGVETKVKAGVDAFVDKYLRNSRFSRDTPAWNHLQEGIPLLIELVTKEVEG